MRPVANTRYIRITHLTIGAPNTHWAGRRVVETNDRARAISDEGEDSNAINTKICSGGPTWTLSKFDCAVNEITRVSSLPDNRKHAAYRLSDDA
jgi:hypothetical protein